MIPLLNNHHLMTRSLFMLCFFVSIILSQSSPPEVQPAIVRVLPHQSRGFTQGLLVNQNLLYESTGLVNRSHIHVLKLEDGSINTSISLKQYFGEGISIYQNKMIQLTWKAQLGFVYSFPELKLIDTLRYQGEGWGLASDSISLIMSNGSDTLYFRDSSFHIIRQLAVTANGYPVKNLNELEYVNGKIYANVWHKDYLVEIDHRSGKVIRIIDCQPLFTIEKPSNPEQVLNGIAYNPQSGTFYLTGKHWKHIFEVTFPQTK